MAHPQFYNYSMEYLAARHLETDLLKRQPMYRLRDISGWQTHSEDVKLIFSMIEGPDDVKDMVCQSIGTGLWER